MYVNVQFKQETDPTNRLHILSLYVIYNKESCEQQFWSLMKVNNKAGSNLKQIELKVDPQIFVCNMKSDAVLHLYHSIARGGGGGGC